jgi:tetratricopeptide (TPR) repeat protein
VSRLADRLAALDDPDGRPGALADLPLVVPRQARPPFWRGRGLLVIVAVMAAIGLAMVAGARYAVSPSVPSRTATPREVVPLAPRPAPGPNAVELRDRALGAMAQGRLAEAADLLGEAVAADPADAQAWHALGVTRARQGHHARAVDALERALDLRPAAPAARRDLAIALDLAGRPGDAARQYRAFLEQAPADTADAADVRRRLGELGAARTTR